MEQSGLVFNIQKFSINDGSGIRTLVFLQGCPLKCVWCSNPESQSFTPIIMQNADKCMGCGTCLKQCSTGALSPHGIDRGLCNACALCERYCPTGAISLSSHTKTVSDVMREIVKDRVFYECSGGGVTLSGGEPLMQWRFAEAILRECKQSDINTAIETTCYAPQEHLDAVLQYTDTVLCDIKCMDSKKHLYYTGVSNERILSNIAHLGNTNKRFIVRVPFITEVNASEDNIRATAEFSARHGAAALHLLPYHRLGEPKYARLGREVSFVGTRPDDDTVDAAINIARSYGLKVSVGG